MAFIAMLVSTHASCVLIFSGLFRTNSLENFFFVLPGPAAPELHRHSAFQCEAEDHRQDTDVRKVDILSLWCQRQCIRLSWERDSSMPTNA